MTQNSKNTRVKFELALGHLKANEVKEAGQRMMALNDWTKQTLYHKSKGKRGLTPTEKTNVGFIFRKFMLPEWEEISQT